MDFDDLEEGFALLRQLQEEEAEIKTSNKSIMEEQVRQLLADYHNGPQSNRPGYPSESHQNNHGHVQPSSPKQQHQYPRNSPFDRNVNHNANQSQSPSTPTSVFSATTSISRGDFLNPQQANSNPRPFSIIPTTSNSTPRNPSHSDSRKNEWLSPYPPQHNQVAIRPSSLLTDRVADPNTSLRSTLQDFPNHSDTIGAIKSPLNTALQSIHQHSDGVLGKVGPIGLVLNEIQAQPHTTPNQNNHTSTSDSHHVLLQQSTQKFLDSITSSSNQLEPTTIAANSMVLGSISIGGVSMPARPKLPGTPSSSTAQAATQSYEMLSMAASLAQKRETLYELKEEEEALKKDYHILQEQVHSCNLLVAKCEKDVTLLNLRCFSNELSPFEEDFIAELIQDYNYHQAELNQLEDKISNLQIVQTGSTQMYNSLLQQINDFNLDIVNLQRELEYDGDYENQKNAIHKTKASSRNASTSVTISTSPGCDHNPTIEPHTSTSLYSAPSLVKKKQEHKFKRIKNQRKQYTQHIIRLQTVMALDSKVKRLVNQLMATTVQNNKNKKSSDVSGEGGQDDQPKELSVHEKELLLLEEKEQGVGVRQTHLAQLKADFQHYDNQQKELMKQIQKAKEEGGERGSRNHAALPPPPPIPTPASSSIPVRPHNQPQLKIRKPVIARR